MGVGRIHESLSAEVEATKLSVAETIELAVALLGDYSSHTNAGIL